jgi:hypothetical protein
MRHFDAGAYLLHHGVGVPAPAVAA